MDKLTGTALQNALEHLPKWHTDNGKLMREYTFADFKQAMEFVNSVADVAENKSHHPDIDIRYNKVTLGLVTHDAGGITAKDADLAKRLDETFGR